MSILSSSIRNTHTILSITKYVTKKNYGKIYKQHSHHTAWKKEVRHCGQNRKNRTKNPLVAMDGNENRFKIRTVPTFPVNTDIIQTSWPHCETLSVDTSSNI